MPDYAYMCLHLPTCTYTQTPTQTSDTDTDTCVHVYMCKCWVVLTGSSLSPPDTDTQHGYQYCVWTGCAIVQVGECVFSQCFPISFLVEICHILYSILWQSHLKVSSECYKKHVKCSLLSPDIVGSFILTFYVCVFLCSHNILNQKSILMLIYMYFSTL